MSNWLASMCDPRYVGRPLPRRVVWLRRLADLVYQLHHLAFFAAYWPRRSQRGLERREPLVRLSTWIHLRVFSPIWERLPRDWRARRITFVDDHSPGF